MSEQGLGSFFTAHQSSEGGALLESIVRNLTISDRNAAASTCKCLAAAVRRVTSALQLDTDEDAATATEAVSRGQYPELVELQLAPSAASDSRSVSSLLIATSPKLQRLTAAGLHPPAIPSLVLAASYQQLRSLQLEFDPNAGLPFGQYGSLAQALGQLSPLTHLTLRVDKLWMGAKPLLCLQSLTCLQQLHLGGHVAATSLPPALTALTLASQAASALPHLPSCPDLRCLTFDRAVLPKQGGTSRHLWSALGPLKALTALEGSLSSYERTPGLVSGSWAEVGSRASQSLPVLQRLRRLCLRRASDDLLSGETVREVVFLEGDLSSSTQLQALWVEAEELHTDLPGVGALPLQLQELHLATRAEGLDMNLDLGAYPALTSLTFEVTSWGIEALPPNLQQLVLIDRGCSGIRLSSLGPLPQLRSLTCWSTDSDLTPSNVEGLLQLAPALERIHFFIAPSPPSSWFSGRPSGRKAHHILEMVHEARCQLGSSSRPAVQISWLQDMVRMDYTLIR